MISFGNLCSAKSCARNCNDLNFSLSARADGQREPDWPAGIDTPLGSPGSLLQCKFQFIDLLRAPK